MRVDGELEVAAELNLTELSVKLMWLAWWMYQPYAGRVPMLFGL